MKKKEIKRQIFHLLFGVSIVTLLYYGVLNALSLFIVTLLVIFGSLLATHYEIFLITWLLKNFERKEDFDTFPAKGMVFYLIGAFLVISLFPADVALAAILVLALGDSLSHIFGLHFGKTKHPLSDKKNLEGMLVGFVAAFLGALLFLEWPEALVASLAAMAIEGIDVKMGKRLVNDNLIIPLIAAISVMILRIVI